MHGYPLISSHHVQVYDFFFQVKNNTIALICKQFLYVLHYFLLIRRVTASEHRGVGAHASRLADLPNAGPAWMGFPVLSQNTR